MPLAVLPGSEVQVTDTAAYRREFEAGLYCHLGDSPAFTLLEFNWNPEQYPSAAADLVGWLCEQGTTPIIAHPERHEFFTADPERLRRIVEAGAWLQVTVDSLLGNHGPAPESSGEELLRAYPDAVLATDAHNVQRCSGLSAVYACIRERLGSGRASELQARADQVLARLAGGSAAARGRLCSGSRAALQRLAGGSAAARGRRGDRGDRGDRACPTWSARRDLPWPTRLRYHASS